MKNTDYIILIICMLTTYSCQNNQPVEPIQEEVEIHFRTGGGENTCGEFCGPKVWLVEERKDFKSKFGIPDSIKTRREFWTKTYIVSIKYLNETCTCKDADAEPLPGMDYPELSLNMVEILEIREK